MHQMQQTELLSQIAQLEFTALVELQQVQATVYALSVITVLLEHPSPDLVHRVIIAALLASLFRLEAASAQRVIIVSMVLKQQLLLMVPQVKYVLEVSIVLQGQVLLWLAHSVLTTLMMVQLIAQNVSHAPLDMFAIKEVFKTTGLLALQDIIVQIL